jgi:NTP pyrophosphatase (non-canonical NTP hydrolase)
MISELTLSAIKGEGMKQDCKWGEQNHEPEIWLAILTEEVGELAQAMLADRFSATEPGMHDSHHDSMEAEAIQIAAVAAHFIEYLARRHVKAAGK